MSLSMKRVMGIAVLVLLGFGLSRAAMFRFQEKEQEFRKGCQAQLQKMGLTMGAAKATYPTPEIHMVSSGCLLAGGTVEVVAKGKFAPGTKFIFENDSLEVVKESLVGGEYRATVKAAPGMGPQSAALTAITPVTCISVRQDRAVTVGGKYEWVMESGNGWKIVARSPADTACGGKTNAEDTYDMQFFRKGESTPFEKRTATLYHSIYERTNYRFSISQQDSVSQAGMNELNTLAKKLADPNLTSAQREALMKQLMKMQSEMQANMAKMTDPAYIKALEAKKLEFGCERIELEVQGGNATGQMSCSQKVGTRIPVKGTLTVLGR